MAKKKTAKSLVDNLVNDHEDFSEEITSAFFQKKSDEIIIKPELESLITPLKNEELVLLKASIEAEGVREPLIIWENNEGKILVDGHNRHRIIKQIEQENGKRIDFKTRIIRFANLDEVKDWMIENQMSRRNLTDLQFSYFRGTKYNRLKDSHGGKREASGQNVYLKSMDKLAEEFKVSNKTIQRDEKFALGIDFIGKSNSDLKRKILSGDEKLNKSIVQKLADLPSNKKISIKDSADVIKLIKQGKLPAQKTPSNNQQISKLKAELTKSIAKINTKTTAKDLENIKSLVIEKLKELEGLLK